MKIFTDGMEYPVSLHSNEDGLFLTRRDRSLSPIHEQLFQIYHRVFPPFQFLISQSSKTREPRRKI